MSIIILFLSLKIEEIKPQFVAFLLIRHFFHRLTLNPQPSIFSTL